MSSLDTGENVKYEFYAFISYKRADSKWADWLYRNLQKYKLPGKLCKKHSELPRRLYPVFMDKEDLVPGNLGETLKEQISLSKYFIAVCSKNSQNNPQYIDLELKYFLETHNNDYTKVIPFIVDESQEPEKECFSPEMQKLCEKHQLIGVNVKERGRRRAFLKVVAYMHGILPNELESFDEKRRKRTRTVTAITTVVAMATSTFLWFYVFPQEKYYVDYVEIYGIPSGIGKLSKDDIEQMDAHYTIVKRLGKVTELRYENFAGKLIDHNNTEYIERPSRAVYKNTGDDEKLNVVYEDSMGRILTEYSYNKDRTYVDLKNSMGNNGPLLANTTSMENNIYASPTGQLLVYTHGNIISYVIEYDSNGYMIERHYAKDTYMPPTPTCDASNIWGVSYEHDDLGRVIEIGYLNYVGEIDTGSRTESSDNYALIEDDYRVCKKKIQYDGYDMVSVQYLNSKNELILNEKIWAECKITYDNRHNRLTESYFDTYNRPTCSSDGYHMLTIKRDGVKHLTYICGGNDLIITNNDGYAYLEVKYNDKGELVFEKYSDCHGNPAIPKDMLFSAVVYVYDDEGRNYNAWFVDANGEVTVDENGVARVTNAYNEQGNWFLQAFENNDSELTEWEAGYALLVQKYQRGKLIAEEYYDSKKEPVTIINGFASLIFAYNNRGNVGRIERLGCDGEILYQDIYKYDEQGNQIGGEILDGNGNRTVDENGLSRWETEYDEYGNFLSESYYDQNDNPVLLKSCGAAKVKNVYDNYGKVVREEYYDVDGESLILTNDNFAVCSTTYTDKGHIFRQEFFGTDGKPVMIKGDKFSYASYERIYDEYGIWTDTIYFDENGNKIEKEAS